MTAMLVALARRRWLLAAVTVAVALAGVVGPALAGAHGCADGRDQHCPPALPAAVALGAPVLLGLVVSAEPVALPSLVVHPLLKVPLPA